MDLTGDVFEFNELATGAESALTGLNGLIDDTIGPLVEDSLLGQLISTGPNEEPPFTDDPDNVGIFDPTGFVFDLLG